MIMTVSKAECVTFLQAAKDLGVSRSTFYHYTKYLDISGIKFPFDKKSYILKTDVERVRQLAEESKQ